MLIYSYGPVAWVWRVLAFAGVLAGGALCAFALRGDLWAVAAALPLMLPGLLLGPMLAVRIHLDGDEAIVVTTLAFWRRRILRSRLGAPWLRTYAQGTIEGHYAPRIWVKVRGALPIHVDLLGSIPHRQAFLRVFPMAPGQLPQRQAPPAD